MTMTVSELIENLKDYDGNAKVYVGVNGKKYDADTIESISYYTQWIKVGKDIIIVSR